MQEIRKELFNARKLYSSENYSESLEIFEKHYENHPEVFHEGFRSNYAWAIYRVHVKHFKSEDELLKSVERITELVSQTDSTKKKYCIYTICVMKVINHLYNENEYYDLPYWLEKINPKLLGESVKDDKLRPNRERYFEIASITYFNVQDFERCIEVSNDALDCVSSFTNGGDAWHRWRIAKSLNEMNRPIEALQYMKEVVKQKEEWYVYRDIADVYFRMGRFVQSMDYLCPAVLSKGPVSKKVNLFYLCYRVLNSIRQPEFALKHAQLYYLLKLESGARMKHDIEMLDIDENELDKKELIHEIMELWLKFKFKDQRLQHGTVTKFFKDRNYGFIQSENDESIFFHKREFQGDNVYVGQLVSFYTEKNFDKSKNRESIKAVYIGGE